MSIADLQQHLLKEAGQELSSIEGGTHHTQISDLQQHLLKEAGQELSSIEGGTHHTNIRFTTTF